MATAGLHQPLLTRDHLNESVRKPGPTDAAEFALLVMAAERLTSTEMAAWLAQWSGEESDQTVEISDAATLVATVQDIEVRDAAWAAIGCYDAHRHIDLWRQVAQVVDGASALPVLGLLGMAAWIGGQGALANMVLDRAAETDGFARYTLFELLQSVLQAGVDPREWETMRVAITG